MVPYTNFQDALRAFEEKASCCMSTKTNLSPTDRLLYTYPYSYLYVCLRDNIRFWELYEWHEYPVNSVSGLTQYMDWKDKYSCTISALHYGGMSIVEIQNKLLEVWAIVPAKGLGKMEQAIHIYNTLKVLYVAIHNTDKA